MTQFQEVLLPAIQGLNQDPNPNGLADGELSIASNCWRNGSLIGTRPGIQREASGTYGSAITGGKEIQGGYEYRSNFDATRNLVFVSNGNVWTGFNTSLDKTTNSVTISNTNGLRWNFAEHKNRLYGAGGAGGDNFWFWDGSNPLQKVTIQDSTGTNVTPAFIFQKWNYGFTSGFTGTDIAANPMIVRYSALGDMTIWPSGSTMGGTSAIGGFSTYGDEFTTGFGEFRDWRGDWLIVLSNRRLYPVLQTPDPLAPFFTDSAIANGCVSQRAFVNLGIDAGDAIYMSEQGVHSLRQSQQHGSEANTFISWKIRDVFNSINRSRLNQVVASYWKTFGLVLFAVSTGSSQVNDTILALDLRDIPQLTSETARWYVWNLSGVNTSFMLPARDSSFQPFIYGGSYTGDIFQFNINVFSDLGVSYTVHFRTKHNTLGSPGRRKAIGNVAVGLAPGGNYQPTLRPIFDYGTPGAPITLDMASTPPFYGSAIYGKAAYGSPATFRKKAYLTGWGDAIAMDFFHNGLNQPFSLAHLSYGVRPLGGTTGGQL